MHICGGTDLHFHCTACLFILYLQLVLITPTYIGMVSRIGMDRLLHIEMAYLSAELPIPVLTGPDVEQLH